MLGEWLQHKLTFSEESCATRRIAAGAASYRPRFAMLLMARASCRRGAHRSKYLHVDDLKLTSQGKSKHQGVRDAVRTGSMGSEECADKLALPFAQQKTLAVASHCKVAKIAARRLGLKK